jgi:hypothetical protein
MFYTGPVMRPKWPSKGQWLACALLVLLGGAAALAFGRSVLVAATSLDTLIQVLFGGLPVSQGVDANRDGALTVADVVVLAVPATPTPTPNPTLTPTPAGLLFVGVVSDLLPHAIGDQLIYQVTDPMGAVTKETTEAVSSDPGGAFVIDDEEVDSMQLFRKYELQSYTDTGTELLFDGYTDELADLIVTCSPPLLRLVTPLIAGQSFSSTIHCSVALLGGTPIGYLDRTDAFTPIDIVDSVEVPAGTFTHVIHIRGSTQIEGYEPETHEIYFAFGVGPILDLKTAGGQTTRSELVSGTIGGVPVAP